MKKIRHTDRIKELERKYWNEHHYLQQCLADPHSTLADHRDCLASVKAAYDQLANAIWTQHRKQHGETAPMAEIRDALKEWITDNLNARHIEAAEAMNAYRINSQRKHR